MPSGYCKSCHKLVPIRAGSQKWGSRQVDWFPVQHNGRACVASGALPNESRYDQETRQHFIGCSGCEAEWPEHEIVSHGGMLPDHCEQVEFPLPACPGDARKIA